RAGAPLAARASGGRSRDRRRRVHADAADRGADRVAARRVRALLPARRHRAAGFPAPARGLDRRVRKEPALDALIAALPGDGIGPEVTAAGIAVLAAVGQRYGHRFEVTEHPIDRKSTRLNSSHVK